MDLKRDDGMAKPHWFGPGAGSGRKKSPGKGHPIMFGFNEAEYFGDWPDGGGYPQRFLARAFDLLGVTDPNAVLHLCSGSVAKGVTCRRKGIHPANGCV